ncbi:hypothetical protein ACJX0J_037240, partial [Zea mays]
NKNKACLVAYLDLATSLNGINRIEVRNSMPSIGKHKNIALKEFNIMPIRASGNKASHIEKLDHGLQKNGVKQKQAQRFFLGGYHTTEKFKGNGYRNGNMHPTRIR